MVSGDTSIRTNTIDMSGVAAILAGTPMQPYAQDIVDLSNKYQIDPNWILCYIQMENGVGAGNTFSLAYNNPFDILCNKTMPGVTGCSDPGNGYNYNVYPSMYAGLEGGYLLWNYYITQGWDTWAKSLAVALCGNLSCMSDPWVQNVIALGQANEAKYPIINPPPPPPSPAPPPSPGFPVVALFGAAFLLGGAALAFTTVRK